MTRVTVKQLIWDAWNLEHIKKHRLTVNEVEVATVNSLAQKKGKKGRYIIIGRSGKRIVSVAVSRKGTGIYYVVTARDADKRERNILYEKESKKQNP